MLVFYTKIKCEAFPMFGSNDPGMSDKHVLFYFKGIKSNALKHRFSDFVFIPELPFISDKNTIVVDDQIRFAHRTIHMLQQAGSKVYPLFLTSDFIEKELESYSIAKCTEIILNEKQYSPTFHFVGHGSPEGIGSFSPITPEDFAEKIENTFKKAGLDALKSRSCRFHFHICNSAYANVSDNMNQSTILNAVYEQSFIGRFYQKMVNLGYTREIEVIGYRGYYQAIASKNASHFILSDAFLEPHLTVHSHNAEYKIKNQQCHTTANEASLKFPVKF